MPGAGRPLPAAERARFERSLDADLRRVRVHDDAAAAVAARDRHAAGFAAGEHVVLGADAREGSVGRAGTLAHELVHVLQQRPGPPGPVQHQDEPRSRGIGAAPLAEAFDVVEGRGPEQAHLTFGQDRADLPPALPGSSPRRSAVTPARSPSTCTDTPATRGRRSTT